LNADILQPLANADRTRFASVRFVLTDMDETLTHQGRLAAATYCALERLQAAGIKVIPVTAAPAGWCDQMARMWPVDGVIGENGGFFFQRRPDGHGVDRRFWHSDAWRTEVDAGLKRISDAVVEACPNAEYAEDQPFRLTSIAFRRDGDAAGERAILEAMRSGGASTTINNLWILGWLGEYDKLSMAMKVLLDAYGLDINSDRDAVLYVGDSTNDAPMFGYFRHTVGVSTVVDYLHEIPVPPRFITKGPGGAGFVEVADLLTDIRG